jgi:hypothetical protein
MISRKSDAGPIDQPDACPTEGEPDVALSPDLAIVSWQALPAIFPDAGKNIGGGETRLWTLAKAIAQHTPRRHVGSAGRISRSPRKGRPLDQRRSPCRDPSIRV